MSTRKFTLSLFTALLINTSFFIVPVAAQFWHVLPPISDSDAISAGFSNDQKKVFFIRRDVGVANVWSTVIMDKYGGIIAGPKNPLVQVTKFTDRGVVRFFHLLNRPEILFMRSIENGKDFHIYRMKDDGSEPAQDLTPGGDGVTNTIIGSSYDGRYVYYTNNAMHQDKLDVYRYDTHQFTSDLIFPNDKDYEVLAWTRDQNKLLVEDPSDSSLMMYNIETTDRTPLKIPPGASISSLSIDPNDSGCSDGYKLDFLTMKVYPGSNGSFDPSSLNNKFRDGLFYNDYSTDGHFSIFHNHGECSVRNAKSHECLPLPNSCHAVAISTKETLVLYLDSSKLFLYDIAKNVSTELATVK